MTIETKYKIGAMKYDTIETNGNAWSFTNKSNELLKHTPDIKWI